MAAAWTRLQPHLHSFIHSLDLKGLGANHDHWISSLNNVKQNIQLFSTIYQNIILTADGKMHVKGVLTLHSLQQADPSLTCLCAVHFQI